jgi:hypothetical protein
MKNRVDISGRCMNRNKFSTVIDISNSIRKNNTYVTLIQSKSSHLFRNIIGDKLDKEKKCFRANK